MVMSQGPSVDVRRESERRGLSKLVIDRGFPYLLDRWEKTVSAIETGYKLLFDEYLNDINARMLIESHSTFASDAEWELVSAALPALDSRFFAATRPVKSCIWGEQNAVVQGYSPDRDWWYYRVPIDVDHVADRERWP